MTNREYLESLSDEELSYLILRPPWELYVSEKLFNDGFGSYAEAIQEWFREEYCED